MSEPTKNASPVPFPVMLILGLGLMFGGMYVSKNIKIPMLEDLAKQGIPIDPGKTVAVIGVFLILFPVIRLFFFDPLHDAIQARTQELERTFAEAEALRSEMTRMKTEYEANLNRTELEAREKIQAQVREAQALKQSLMAEANQVKDQMIAQAQEEIARERDRVMNELRIEVVNLTLGATERILGENVSDARNRQLVQEFIEKAEVPQV